MSTHPGPLQKVVAIALISCVLMVPARPANAIFGVADIVFDPTIFIQSTLTALFEGELNVKEFVLDLLVRQAAEVARQTVLRSIITWANSGFEGSPAFVTNLQNNLRGLSDYVADSFTAELEASGVINSPFRDGLVQQLRNNYRRMSSDQAFFETNRYTLDQYSSNPDAFLRGSFNDGGIRAWIHAWMNPQNNPLGAYGAARRELENRIARATGERRDEVNRNNGFLDFCVPTSSGEETEAESTSLRPAVVGCRPGETRRNLGSLTHDAVSRALGSDIEMIVSADEISELFQAIANGLFKRAFSESGLLGLSESSTGEGGSPLDQAGAVDVPVGTLTGTIDSQIRTLTEYRAQWQRIDEAVDEAQAECDAGGDPEMLAEVNTAAAQVLAALTDINLLLNELNSIRTRLVGTNTQQIRQATQEYQTLASSGRLPTPSEINYANLQSQNIAGSEPPTLFMRMTEIAARNCNE